MTRSTECILIRALNHPLTVIFAYLCFVSACTILIQIYFVDSGGGGNGDKEKDKGSSSPLGQYSKRNSFASASRQAIQQFYVPLHSR
jgi:hypothetical protein